MIDILKSYNGVCVIDYNDTYDYQQLIDSINKIRKELEGKITQNEKIVIVSDYNFYSISLLLVLSEYPINIIPIVNNSEKELEEKIDVVKPNKIISFDKKGIMSINIVQPLLENSKVFNEVTSNGDTGIVLFSSGTTGKPKIMIQNLTQIIRSIRTPRKQKSLIFIILLMFDHIGGLNTLLNCLISGSPFVIPKDRNPSTIIDLIERNRVNILPTSPTFLNLMLMDERFNESKLSSIKLITYGTESMSISLLNKLNRLLPGIKLLQTFGTSETGILKTQSKSSNSLFFKIIDEDNDYKVVDGELFLKSITAVKGYVNHSNENFKTDGWYATGDLVEEDEEGYIKIIGRKNKIINVGGLKVLPSEVENIINQVEGVIDSTVFAQENNISGNIVCAKVFTLLNDHQELKIRIKKHCRENLEKYKVPIKINFSDFKITERGKKC